MSVPRFRVERLVAAASTAIVVRAVLQGAKAEGAFALGLPRQAPRLLSARPRL